jgi:hypothetical protein
MSSQSEGREGREWTLYVCPTCGAWSRGPESSDAVPLKSVNESCDYANHGAPEPVVVVPKADLDEARESFTAYMKGTTDAAREINATANGILAERDSLRAENERLKEREAHFARVLGVADGGQYRNDWDSRLQAVLDENERLREALERFKPSKHPTTCPMHVMHDWFYDGTDEDREQASLPVPRRCECEIGVVEGALASLPAAGQEAGG